MTAQRTAKRLLGQSGPKGRARPKDNAQAEGEALPDGRAKAAVGLIHAGRRLVASLEAPKRPKPCDCRTLLPELRAMIDAARFDADGFRLYSRETIRPDAELALVSCSWREQARRRVAERKPHAAIAEEMWRECSLAWDFARDVLRVIDDGGDYGRGASWLDALWDAWGAWFNHPDKRPPDWFADKWGWNEGLWAALWSACPHPAMPMLPRFNLRECLPALGAENIPAMRGPGRRYVLAYFNDEDPEAVPPDKGRDAGPDHLQALAAYRARRAGMDFREFHEAQREALAQVKRSPCPPFSSQDAFARAARKAERRLRDFDKRWRAAFDQPKPKKTNAP